MSLYEKIFRQSYGIAYDIFTDRLIDTCGLHDQKKMVKNQLLINDLAGQYASIYATSYITTYMSTLSNRQIRELISKDADKERYKLAHHVSLEEVNKEMKCKLTDLVSSGILTEE